MELRAQNLVKSHAALCIALAMLAGCRSSAVRDSDDTTRDSGRATIPASGIIPAQYVPEDSRPTAAKPNDFAGPHSVDFYVRYALANNQAIQAAVNEVEAADNRIPQARSLDDPMLESKGYPFFPNTPQSASGRATAGVGVSQKFPWFGKLRLQGEIAHEELHVAQARLAATQLEVTEQTKRVYFEVYYVQRAISITQESRKVLEQIAQFASIRYEVKKEVSQQDVLRPQTELANLDAELVRLRQELIGNQARLARLLHVSPNTNLQADEQIPEADAALELERLYEVAVAARPELQAELHMVARERRAKELACKQYYPDATIGVEWMENTTHKAIAPTADGLDDVGLNLSVNLPIYRIRLDAAVREAEARTLAAARRYDSERDQTLEMIKGLFAQLESQRDLVQLFGQNILPKAQQTLQVSMVDYQTGRVDLLQLLSNFQEVLKIQLMLQRQRSQLQQTLSSLERAVGGDLK